MPHLIYSVPRGRIEASGAGPGNFHVISGGPGSGKSTLIQALRQRGFRTTLEAGRVIIQEQSAIGSQALPWADRAAFAELMLGWEIHSHRESGQERGPVFFDRGVPDVAGYLKLCGLPVPGHVHKACEEFRYNPRVFIAPPWREIYHADAERKQSWAEAEATCQSMIDTYSAYGYRIELLPLASVEERVRFVLKSLFSNL
ncbi:ATPase [Deltaproteobacteria bacterium Smac51]|nr:ATPase [Deltaproteobacteria bacterium Smac51]